MFQDHITLSKGTGKTMHNLSQNWVPSENKQGMLFLS
jgi:hypothetical protein